MPFKYCPFCSTLFGSMLQHSGHSTVFGEHPALTTIAIGFCQGYWNEKDVMQLLNPTIKILRKNSPPNYLLHFKN
uniref:Uncharacterized protein n=1 Tax=Panagrolaimus sp. PS1159 TaxID=55785 RepID=A0AC35GIT0_9BILA